MHDLETYFTRFGLVEQPALAPGSLAAICRDCPEAARLLSDARGVSRGGDYCRTSIDDAN